MDSADTIISQHRKFWERVDASGDCWQWIGRMGPNGYGHFTPWTGKTVSAHRWVWEILVAPIPPKLVIDHICRNRRCVNPDHLRVVTQRENLIAGNTIIARFVGRTRCPQGHPYDDTNTRVDKHGHRTCKTCTRARCRDYYRRTRAA